MTRQTVKPYLLRAQQEGWAVGAFNANTLEQIQAIIAAAQQETAPVIIQISHRALQYAGDGNPTLGLRYMAEAARVAAESVEVPVSIHLDHAPEAEVLQAIALGFTSIMFDGGEFPLEENIAATCRVCEAAHSMGVTVEAELGEVPRADLAGKFEAADELTDPQEAAQFVKATGIDVLAIALGSVHAVREKTVTLDLDRLRAIRQVVDVPLVLHGSSGVNDEYVTQGIRLGLAKVNVATQLNQSFTRAIRQKLADDPGLVDPRRYLELGRAAMVETVRERIRFFGASGKAC
jgi:fructose-bisphosphate aldolase, class II